MEGTRKVKQTFKSQPTLEGAGVHLKRVFGYHQIPQFDPFLLLDDFHANEPDKYLAGFPWHPHRGIETITYVFEGRVAHGDSLGNQGMIGAGEVQWMTAGSGIVHQEMPEGEPDGRLWGIQLWANLPAADKMMAPRYRGLTASDIPVVKKENGATIKVICGTYEGIQGPVGEVVIDPEYLDISLPGDTSFQHPLQAGYTVFAYALRGDGHFDDQQDRLQGSETAYLYGEGTRVNISAGSSGLRFLLISGRPLKEPIAWGGPIVMNTRDELETAFAEYRQGTFLKNH